MRFFLLTVAMTLSAALSLQSAVAEDDAPGALLPSEALVLILWEAMHRPEASREQVFEPVLPRVIVDDLDDDELFFLGEVYFFALMPEEARDAYYPLRDGTSLRARVAWQRLLQIRFRAFEMYDRVAREMVRFRERFPPDPADRTYLYHHVLNFGRMHAGAGEHDKTVAAVEAELAALDYSGAYDSLMLPSTFIESYRAQGKLDQALRHLRRARDGLAQTLEARLADPPEEDQYYLLPARRYAFFFSPVTEKLGWEQHNDKFRELIRRLEEAIASIEGSG